MTIDLAVTVDQGCGVEDAVAFLTGPRKSYGVTLHPAEPNENHVTWTGSVRLDPRDLRNSEAGTWKLRYQASGDDASESVAADAKVRRATRISFNAGPEPVRNDKLTFSGRVERASWNSRRYAGVSKTVVVQHIVDDDYDDVVSVKSKKNGTFRTTTFPGPSLYWADFDGGQVSGASTSPADRVDAP